MTKLIPVEPQGEGSPAALRKWPLLLIGGMGLAGLLAAVGLDRVASQPSLAPSVLLEIGAGLLLFSVLFWTERGLIVKEVGQQTKALLEALTGSADQIAELLDDPDVITRFSEDGIVDVVFRFVRSMTCGAYQEGWALADGNWQLSRIQSWLWNNREFFGEDTEAIASDLFLHQTESPYWEHFEEVERSQFMDVWSGVHPDKFGAGSARRVVGVGYEVINLVPLDDFPDGVLLHAPHYVQGGLRFLMHFTGEEGWRVASHIADAPPCPGWPPSWWSTGDPPVIEATDELLAEFSDLA